VYKNAYLIIYIWRKWEREHDYNSGSVGGDYNRGGSKGKENFRKWVILKYIASVYEDDITKCTVKGVEQ
jgi:hypothetical protein